jgi:hypothetical protein
MYLLQCLTKYSDFAVSMFYNLTSLIWDYKFAIQPHGQIKLIFKFFKVWRGYKLFVHCNF